MKKQFILGALLALVCACQSNSSQNSSGECKSCNKCGSKKCNVHTTEAPKPAVAETVKEQGAVVEVVKVVEAVVEAKKAE